MKAGRKGQARVLVGFVSGQEFLLEEELVGELERLGFAAVRLGRAVAWQADHTDAVVGVGAVSASPGGLVGIRQ